MSHQVELWAWPNVMSSVDARYLGATETARAFSNFLEWEDLGKRATTIGIFGPTVWNSVTQQADLGQDTFLKHYVDLSHRLPFNTAVEAGPIGNVTTPTGAGGADADMNRIVDKIYAIGGRLDYIQMDHPLRRFIDNLALSLTDACIETVNYMERIHEFYPHIRIGMVDNFTAWNFLGKPTYNGPSYAFDFNDAWPQLMAQVGVAGEDLAFLHADMDWEHTIGWINQPGRDLDHWVSRYDTIGALARSSGVPWGWNIASAIGGGNINGQHPAPNAPPGSNALYSRLVTQNGQFLRDLMLDGQIVAPDRILVEDFYHYPRVVGPYEATDSFIYTALATARQWDEGVDTFNGSPPL